MTDWIFQDNPKLYDVQAAVNASPYDTWSTPRYRDLLAVGDKVWLQIVGPRDPGIYYIASITSLPYETVDSEFGPWHVDIRWDFCISPPLLRAELLSDPLLGDFRPLRGFHGTNIPVPEEAVRRLNELSSGRLVSLGSLATPSPELDVSRAIEHHNAIVRQQLRHEIKSLSPTDFELLVTRVLTAIGYDVEHTGQTKDGAVDALAVLSFGGLTAIITKVQAKRWAQPVPAKVVRELRGALKVGEQGLVVTTAEFTADAKREAEQEGKAPIGLLGGEALVRLCAEHSIGVEQRQVGLLRLDTQGLAAAQ
jgi:hypothetical protein